jgi:hypothetical protein
MLVLKYLEIVITRAQLLSPLLIRDVPPLLMPSNFFL